jgi:hypothetical protein
MYEARWSPGLRQGDILGPITLPLIGKNVKFVGSASTLTRPSPAQAMPQVIVDTEERFVAVVSHDCEFNEAKRNKLLVARLQAVPRNLSDEEVARVRESNDIQAVLTADPEATIAGVDSFLVEAVPPRFDEARVVNFATITALPMAMKQDLQSAKRAEMDQASRVLFRNKLAWFFGRIADDISDAERIEPPKGE